MAGLSQRSVTRAWLVPVLVWFSGVVATTGQQAPDPGASQPAAPRTPAPPATQTAGPMVRENATVKVAEHTYLIPDFNVGAVPNIGIIVGQRGALVIDTGLGVRNGETVVREVRKVSAGPELYLVTTHIHPEHDLGAEAFPAATKMIRSREQQSEIDEVGLESARNFSRNPVMAELLKGASFRKADISFDREHQLDLGGATVRIMAMGANHTRGDTAFFVENDRVLFSGDIAMPNLPVFSSPTSSIRTWLASLDRLSELKPVKVIPSHGEMGDVRLIAEYREFLQAVQKRVVELKAGGKTLEETTALVSQELQPKYASRQPARIAGAVRVAYNEAP